jgi:hypothetical protein
MSETQKNNALILAEEIKYLSGLSSGKIKKRLMDNELVIYARYVTSILAFIYLFKYSLEYFAPEYLNNNTVIVFIFIMIVVFVSIKSMRKSINRFRAANLYSKIKSFSPSHVSAFMEVKKGITEDEKLGVVSAKAYDWIEDEINTLKNV